MIFDLGSSCICQNLCGITFYLYIFYINQNVIVGFRERDWRNVSHLKGSEISIPTHRKGHGLTPTQLSRAQVDEYLFGRLQKLGGGGEMPWNHLHSCSPVRPFREAPLWHTHPQSHSLWGCGRNVEKSTRANNAREFLT